MIYRGVQGATAFVLPYQAARTYPTETPDPSLGMPHQFLQVQNHLEQGKLIAPSPYETAAFQVPPWIDA